MVFRDRRSGLGILGRDLSIGSVPWLASEMDTTAVTSPLHLGSPRPAGVPAFLGGCLVRRELARRNIGPVYLARQLAFDRDVALGVMKPQWAGSATFVARFTREAYAAAQLSHHHIASIYEFGEEKGIVYFNTEFVDGRSLGDMARDNHGPEFVEAVGYVLQAARGLKCAHDQNMFHRDLSPETLVVGRHGLVKVVDLGLGKTPDADLAEEAALSGKPTAAASESGQTTLPSISLGTPGYAAPELAANPAGVGPRTDIYSLGCTLYFLLTGRPPFEGRTAVEILNQQQNQPLVPPDECVKSVPKSLWAIVLKMTARKPEDRHADMGDVIRDLEAALGISSAGPGSKGEEQSRLLEQNATAWHESPSARLRARITTAILAACLGLALVSILLGWWFIATALLSLGVFAALADFAVVGLERKTQLFQRVVPLFLGSSLSEWLTVLAAVALLIGLLLILKLFWIWVALALAAVGIAFGLRVLDLHAESERRGPFELIEAIVRSLRREGFDEDLVRQFVCSSCGWNWEEVYESLFGYESMVRARDRWGRGDGARNRPRHAAWRDPIIRWIDARLAARREAKEQAVLQKFEERALEAQGISLLTARRKGERAAKAMVATAAEIRETIRPREGTIMVNRSITAAMREAAVKPESVLLDHERGVLHDRDNDRERTKTLTKLANIILGPKIRFLAGAALLAGCIAWMHQNAMISAEHATALVDAAKSGDMDAVQTHAQAGVAHAREQAAKPTQRLDLPALPAAVLAILSSFGAGSGGLFLIISSLVGGVRIAFFAIPAAAISIFGARLGLPPVAGLDASVIPTLIGAGLLAAGLIFARK
jgi:eukaryotic-like serine/threonine-protein kinase